MPDTISATGLVATPPVFAVVGSGLARLTFRLASTQRKFNREASGWENGETNWYTVVAFRRLAENSSRSLSKSDRVVVTGRLRVNEWEREGRRGTTVELIADGIGHDLTFGTTTFTRSASAPVQQSAEPSETDVLDSSPSAAVDSGGWALPGGGSAEGDGAQSASTDLGEHEDAADERSDQSQSDQSQGDPSEFAMAEPPF